MAEIGEPCPCRHEVGLNTGSAAADVRLIAFYLPQFHPIPENDLWWGKGFSEWTNVTKAVPLFEGHYQPHLPSELGFYDLRLREVRHEQIALAQQYGIDGFCYHYYWFSGKRLLERPLDDMLADSESTMPFCLCWANENWTRRWDGAEKELLIEQKYAPGDAAAFAQSLLPFLADPRYIRHKGRPLLVVYKPQAIPDALRTVDVWRDTFRSAGIGEVHVCGALTQGNNDYAGFGLDSGVEFPPHNLGTGNVTHDIPVGWSFGGTILEFPAVARFLLERRYRHPDVFRTVVPSWDNTARTGARAQILLGGTPPNYEFWLSEAVRATGGDFPGEERFVFINAWNEWAEGCHLEPDRKYGRAFLEATLRVKQGRCASRGFEEVRLNSPPDRSFGADLGEVLAFHALRLKRWGTAPIYRFLVKHPRLKDFLFWKVVRHFR